MALLIDWLSLALGVYVASLFVPGFKVEGLLGAFVAAALFGVVHTLLGGLLFGLLGVATLGLGFLVAFLTRWVVDALLLKLADALTDRLTIRGFLAAFLAGLVINFLGSAIGEVLKPLLLKGPA